MSVMPPRAGSSDPPLLCQPMPKLREEVRPVLRRAELRQPSAELFVTPLL